MVTTVITSPSKNIYLFFLLLLLPTLFYRNVVLFMFVFYLYVFMFMLSCITTIGISEGININKTDGSCKCKIFYYGFCFITNFSFQPNVKRKEVRIKFILGV